MTIDNAATTGVYIHDNPANTNGPSAFVDATILNNFISNTDKAILIEGDDATATINDNSLTSFAVSSIDNSTPNNVDATCNWYGTSVFSDVTDAVSGPVTFVPYLSDGTDDDPGTVGFQPAPMSCIGGPVQVFDGNTFIGVYTEIQTAIDDATTLSGHTVRIASGTYVENVDAVSGGKDLTFAPGASPGCVTITGDLTLNAGDALEIEIDGTTPCTEHDPVYRNGYG